MGLDVCLIKIVDVPQELAQSVYDVLRNADYEHTHPYNEKYVVSITDLDKKPHLQILSPYFRTIFKLQPDFTEAFKKRGLNFYDWEQYADEDETKSYFFYKDYGSEKQKEIHFQKRAIPIVNRSFQCLFIEDNNIGELRKGANQQFYADGMWDSPNTEVALYQTVLEHWVKYFNSEYSNKIFKEQFIWKFIEGETILCYW